MQQKIAQLLVPILRFVAPHRVVIIKIFKAVEIAILVLWAWVFWQATQDVTVLYSHNIVELGAQLGSMALYLYCLTLLPGIINRSKVWPMVTQPIGSIIMPFRRHLGILMFLTAFVHMSFTTTLLQVISNGYNPFAIQLVTFQLFGMIAWWSLFPLWLTSNDQSMKFLGKNWKRVHRLTYVALFFIFLHVAMQGEGSSLIIGAVGVAEAFSWYREWQKNRIIPQVSPTS